MNGGVIVVEDDPDVIHVDNSSDLALSTSLNDLEITALYIDGQSIDVDAPPDIIDVVDEDDDIIDEEDPIPHDLADSDDEDLVNLDIDDGANMSADVAWGHGGDGGGDDHPPPYHVPTGCGGCLGNQGHLKSQFGWQESGQAAYTPGDPEPRNAALWANYRRELVGSSIALPFLAPNVAARSGFVAKIWVYLRPPHGIRPAATIYSASSTPAKDLQGTKCSPKKRYWVPEEDGTYDLESLKRGRPSYISEDEMLRLQGLGSNTPTGVPYTEDEIMAIVRGGKQRGHIPGVGRDIVFLRCLNSLESQPEHGGAAEVAGAGMGMRPGDDEDDGEIGG
ncbi:hypothetical protein Tco_1234965 [Tanacetum coccineum]